MTAAREKRIEKLTKQAEGLTDEQVIYLIEKYKQRYHFE